MASPPWLEKRGTRFYAHWSDSDSGFVKRLSLRTADSGQAERRFAAWLIERGRTDTVAAAISNGVMTVEMVFADYVRERGPKIESIEVAKKAERYLNLHFGKTPVSHITQDNIDGSADQKNRDGYIWKRAQGKIGDPAGDSTVRRELGVLIAAINHAVQRKRLSADLAPSIERPEEPEGAIRWLTRDELALLFRTALDMRSLDESARLPRAYRFATLAYYTASRRAALEKLTWFQVLDNQQIQLNPTGRKQTKKRRPLVPMDKALVPIIEQAKREKVSEFVLDRPGSVYAEFMEVVQACGLVDVSPHTMRHSRATHLLQDGVNPWAVAGLLGDRLTTVLKTYSHHCPQHIREAINGVIPGSEFGRVG